MNKELLIPTSFTGAGISAIQNLNTYLETAFFLSAIAVAIWELWRRTKHTKWYKDLKKKYKKNKKGK